MEALLQDLESIAAHLRRLKRRAADLLRPPLSRRDIYRQWGTRTFAPTAELELVYQWHDGTEANEGDLLEDLHFFPGYYFVSLEEALITYDQRARAPQWQEGWFPLFSNGAGDFYLVACERSPVSRAPVVGFLHGEPEQPVEYEDLTRMVRTLSEAYARQAIFLTPDGSLELDDESYDRIARLNNPNIGLWQR